MKPEPFEQIVPKPLPRKKELVYVSGVAELACAAGLLHPRTRRPAGLASAGLLVAVFPANVQMALDLHRKGSPDGAEAIAFARLPLQIPLIRCGAESRPRGQARLSRCGPVDNVVRACPPDRYPL